ncbi:MAG: ABC transporter ATP-binding protein [Candidatus Hodarchaeota archaeon]
MPPLLEVNNISKRFGGIQAVSNCNFIISEGEICGLIGPNGSGKTTILNLITGILKPDSGEMYFRTRLLNRMKVHEISRMGIGRTFQITQVFKRLSVTENLLVGTVNPSEDRVTALLKFFKLFDLKSNYARALSFGQQKLLELAALTIQNPSLFLLDEPAAGINPRMINDVASYIKDLQGEGKTFVIVEHNIPFIMKICDKVIVLDKGEKIAEGIPQSIRQNERVIEAYLGAE